MNHMVSMNSEYRSFGSAKLSGQQAFTASAIHLIYVKFIFLHVFR